MKWIDINNIAISLEEFYPEVDVINIRFTDLKQLVLSLPNFKDEPNKCNEKILEAIQSAWIDERD